MENNKSFKVMAIVALCVSVIGVSVAFAALSEDLTVDGYGVVDPVSWDIHFENISAVETAGEYAYVGADPEIVDEVSVMYDFVFRAPGDMISFTVDVKNDGELDAKITSLIGTEVEKWTYNPVVADEESGEYVEDTRDSASDDVNMVMQNLIFSLTYEDGTAVAVDDTLEVGVAKTLVLTVTYDTNATDVPDGLVEVVPEDLVITYTQN